MTEILTNSSPGPVRAGSPRPAARVATAAILA